MCCEACCCPGLAVSGTRFAIMEHYMLSPDECDNRLIRFNNFIQCLSCICDCAARFDDSFEDMADCLNIIAEVVFFSTAGCMISQVNNEIAFREENEDTLLNAPTADTYEAAG